MRYTTRPLAAWDGPRTPHTQRRSRYAFRSGWADTLELLERELTHLSARDLVLQIDIREQDLRLDGMPRSNAREPIDPGVRLSFESKHGPLVYQCDSVDGWRENVRSIALGLQALRAVDRYGITRHAEQYSGWRQIGSGPSIVPDPPMDRARAAGVVIAAAYSDAAGYPAMRDLWVSGLIGDAGEGPVDLDVVARRAARKTHPDTGGSAEAFDEVQRAITLLRGAS